MEGLDSRKEVIAKMDYKLTVEVLEARTAPIGGWSNGGQLLGGLP